jgi:hypothetical protein
VLQMVAKGAGDVTGRALGHRNRVRPAVSIGQVFQASGASRQRAPNDAVQGRL